MESDLDYALALSLQDQFRKEEERKRMESEPVLKNIEKRYDPRRVVDASWELEDPHPNIHDLFVQFDAMFFDSALVNAGVEVRWSPRMTLCAGVCSYEGRGGLCSVRLSIPLLKLRPRKDLVQTLLHEMIHAFLFVTENNRDHDAHGPNFRSHMHRINSLTGANITVFHNFHQEVNLYRQHWWKCSGPCQNRPPYYGLVKRATNRAPSPRDFWWSEHQRTCGGAYTKIKEPEGYGEKKAVGRKEGPGSGGGLSSAKGKDRASGYRDIKDMFKRQGGRDNRVDLTGQSVPKSPTGSAVVSKVNSFVGEGHQLSSSSLSAKPASLSERRQKLLAAAEKRKEITQQRGLKRKAIGSGCRDIRPFITSPAKRPKTTSHRETDVVILENGSDTHKAHSTQSSVGTSSGTSQNSSSSAGMAGSPVINLVDEEEEINVPVRMCPVCGLTDIPAAIINIHVTYCLDEELDTKAAISE